MLPRAVFTATSCAAVKSCHAHHSPFGVLKPSGCICVALAITYCTDRFDEGVVLPKCTAARSASWPSCCAVAWNGASVASSAHTPASGVFVVGCVTCVARLGQVVEPLAMPWQYCVVEVLHVS